MSGTDIALIITALIGTNGLSAILTAWIMARAEARRKNAETSVTERQGNQEIDTRAKRTDLDLEHDADSWQVKQAREIAEDQKRVYGHQIAQLTKRVDQLYEELVDCKKQHIESQTQLAEAQRQVSELTKRMRVIEERQHP